MCIHVAYYYYLGVFKLSEAIADATLEHFKLEINLEPLLMTIVAGYDEFISYSYYYLLFILTLLCSVMLLPTNLKTEDCFCLCYRKLDRI